MAELPLSRAFERANPLPISRVAIERQIETLIALLDLVDGDPDLEDADEDCCAAYDDELSSVNGYAPWLAGPGDPEDAEDCLSFAPCIIHGVYQGTNGVGLASDLAAGDTFNCGALERLAF